MGLDFCQDLLDRLGFDQADIALGDGFMRQDRFGAGTAITPVDAIDGQGRPTRQALKIVTFLRLVETQRPKRLFDLGYINRQVRSRKPRSQG